MRKLLYSIWLWIKAINACFDLLFLMLNLKVSMGLNWITGRAPKDFFAPATYGSWVIVVFSVFLQVRWGMFDSTLGAFIAVTWYIFVWDSKQAKKWFDAGSSIIILLSIHRTILVWIMLFGLVSLNLSPADGIRYFAYLVCLYGRCCYLYDIPPRDSVFARAKNKLKNIKLPKLAPVPSPA